MEREVTHGFAARMAQNEPYFDFQAGRGKMRVTLLF
jgi:hypothetical protein